MSCDIHRYENAERNRVQFNEDAIAAPWKKKWPDYIKVGIKHSFKGQSIVYSLDSLFTHLKGYIVYA